MSSFTPGFSTLAVHAGNGLERGDLWPQDEQLRGSSATEAVLEERLAVLEGGAAAVSLSAGRAARMLALQILLRPGDNVVMTRGIETALRTEVFGGFTQRGWESRLANAADPSTFADLFDERTRAIFIESFSQTHGGFIDIAAIADMGQQFGIPLIVDNSTATSYLVRPLEQGADLVVYARLDFVGGAAVRHGGALVDGGIFDWSRSDAYPLLSAPMSGRGERSLHDIYGNIAFATAARRIGHDELGLRLGHAEASMILAGIETLSLRMQRHCDNAIAVANWLKGQLKVARVTYPGLELDAGHLLQRACSPKGAGAGLTFELSSGHASQFIDSLQLFSTRGGPNISRSSAMLIEAPGEGGAVISLALGLEDVADLLADLAQAMGELA